MSDDLTIRVSRDEALVLFEFCARFYQDGQPVRIKSNAEYFALNKIFGQFEETLLEPFQSDYQELLASASARVADGYNGLAPGVEP